MLAAAATLVADSEAEAGAPVAVAAAAVVAAAVHRAWRRRLSKVRPRCSTLGSPLLTTPCPDGPLVITLSTEGRPGPRQWRLLRHYEPLLLP